MPSTDDPGSTTTVRVAAEADLVPLAATVAATLPPHAFVALAGDLGAGKTTFVKAFAAALGIAPAEVTSPTFGLIHIHEGPRGRLVHADLHRLAGPADLRETGWEDAIRGVADRPCRVFVEWPDRAADALPPERLDVAFTIDSETGRTLAFSTRSPAYAPVILALRRWPRA